MYSWLREVKPRKHPENTTFSSSLLDEILRSIERDDDEIYEEEYKFYKGKSTRKQYSGDGGFRAKANSIHSEEMASLKRTRLMEKLMERKVNDRSVSSQRRPPSSLPETKSRSVLKDIDDSMFFTTSSSSFCSGSGSGSGSGGLSSSDAENFSSARSRNFCFGGSSCSRHKTNKKTNVPPQPNPLYHENSEYNYVFDDYKRRERSQIEEKLIISSKSTASKIYSNLKKVKQPISPGLRLTNFINSLFHHGNTDKKKKNLSRNGEFEYSKSTTASTCSSATSFSRSCLSKTGADSKEKFNNGVERTVRFYPVSVIVDENSRPCGHKFIYDEEFERYKIPHSSSQSAAAGLKSQILQKNRKVEVGARGIAKGSYQNQKKDNFMMERIVRRNFGGYYDDDDEDDDDDASSDSSSDLFEIDHLAYLRSNKFCEELPVYETTHLGRSHAIARGLIC